MITDLGTQKNSGRVGKPGSGRKGEGEGGDKGDNKKRRGGSNKRGGEEEGNNYSVYKNEYSIYI